MALLVVSLFSLALYLPLALVRAFSPRLRKDFLYLSLLTAVLGTGALLLSQPYMNLRLNNLLSQAQAVPSPLNEYPFNALGQIIVRNGLIKPCTASLIAEDKALTSAQCLVSLRGGQKFIDPKTILIRFPGGLVRNVSAFTAGPRFSSSDKKGQGYATVKERVQDDWAIVTLTEKVTDRRALTLANQHMVKKERVFLTAGYNGSQQPAAIKGCVLLSEDLYDFFIDESGHKGIYSLHSCPQWEQSAGIPFLFLGKEKAPGNGYGEPRYKIIALHSSLIGVYGTTLGVATSVAGLKLP